MNESEAKRLVETTFSNPFDEGRFLLFARNLLDGLDEHESFDCHGASIKELYRDHVGQFKRLGTYRAPDGLNTDVLVVRLIRDTALDRARTMQRNFVADYMKRVGGPDATLVGFYTDGAPDDWRFSFVRIELMSAVGSDGRVKTIPELSPARRYSFLVGKNEPHHTALQRLWPLLTHEHNKPTLAAIENAFEIESVTKKFFEKYKELFLKIKEEIDRLADTDIRIASEFRAKSINIADFTKKLMGQIVFLYFLQKKGWLCVQKDATGAFKQWGTGPKNFLKSLFAQTSPAQNFFNDILEPLFYEALAIERTSNYYHRLNCQIPFLNGGLFEPMNRYNWVEVDIPISNDVFRELFETFDMFNFTVREDEPLDKEVAVDPEMLGKVFENLLEIRDRKSKGAYYTPREVVHFMCQESLIHYLAGRIPEIGHDKIAYFIRHGQSAVEIEAGRAQGSANFRFAMPAIMENADKLDTALADIRICDPAIGSGAFPVGMLTEIVNARDTLTKYLGASAERNAYEFKRHAITTCIYGVDIDAGAIEIAKLRLWLSLVVDEDDFENIRPLPNLDFKIRRGNSLQPINRDTLSTDLADQVEALKVRYVEETSPSRKEEIRKSIARLMAALTGGRDVFDFRLHFSEVFHLQNGFDITIANPPYVRHEAIKDQKPMLKAAFGSHYCGTADLYTYFYKRGIEILRANGHLCYIAPNKFMKAGYGKNTRNLLGYQNRLRLLVDFCELPVFDAATDPAIVLVQKASPQFGETYADTVVKSVEELKSIAKTVSDRITRYRIDSLSVDRWMRGGPASRDLVFKIESCGIALGNLVKDNFHYGIKTGFNQAFVIDEQVRRDLVMSDPHCADIIVPWLDGDEIRRWKCEWSHQYLIRIPSSANADWIWSGEASVEKAYARFEGEYPSLAKHLSKWHSNLIGRDDQGKFWWELRSCSYWDVFSVPRIVFNECSKELHAYLETNTMVQNKTGFVIISDENEFVLAVLNSSLMDFYYRSVFQAWGDPWNGGRLQFQKEKMVDVRIPAATTEQKNAIAAVVRQIQLSPRGPDAKELEKKLDLMVLGLFHVDERELLEARAQALG